MAIVLVPIFHYIPQYGQTHIVFYMGVCSLVVMSVKALGIALKLTFLGMNQLTYPQTWAFATVVIVCVLTQMIYLNKALDTFNMLILCYVHILNNIGKCDHVQGLGQAESNSDRYRNVWVHHYSFWDISSSQNRRHG